MRAADGSDLAYGGRGDDAVAGGDGRDRLYGGSDADQVLGGNGNDRAAGNRGSDVVQGGDGNDSLFGGWGPDRVFGGSGNDELHALAADGDPDLLNCGPGNDRRVGPALGATSDADRRLRDDLRRRVTVSPDQDEGENADADTEADCLIARRRVHHPVTG